MALKERHSYSLSTLHKKVIPEALSYTSSIHLSIYLLACLLHYYYYYSSFLLLLFLVYGWSCYYDLVALRCDVVHAKRDPV